MEIVVTHRFELSDDLRGFLTTLLANVVVPVDAPAAAETPAAVLPPPVVESAPVAEEQSKVRRSALFSDERDAVLRRDWPAGVDRAVICEALNALPGPVLAAEQLKRRASDLSLARPANMKRGPGGCVVSKRWTPERRDLIRRDWPAGVPVAEIRAALDNLPGLPMKDDSGIAVQAAWLGVKRPVGFMRRLKHPHPVVAEVKPAPAPSVAEVKPTPAPLRKVVTPPRLAISQVAARRSATPLPPMKTPAQIKRDRDAADVASFIADKGVTRCPVAAANATMATLPSTDRAALRAHTEGLETARLAEHQRRMDGKKHARAVRAGA